jgi:DNA-binding NarL/FixJ family response regulator
MNQPDLPGTLPFAGRAAELAALHAALAITERGEGSTWLVTGTSGIGKSRLGRRLAGEAQRRGFAVASGRAFPVDAGVPYALFSDALLPTVRRLDEQALMVLTRGVGELTQLFPWLGQPPAKAADAQTADFRNRLHWHFTQFLRGLVAQQPMLVVLEDLQWADTSSLELLHFLARHTADSPLLLFCTLNTDHGPPLPALRSLEHAVRTLPRARELRLEPLAHAEVEELVCRAFRADGHLTRAFALRLFGWTRGNPFFIEETLKLLVSSGDLRLEDGHWTGWQVDTLRLPTSVRDVILARLDELGAAARDVAELCAVFGSRFTIDTLNAVRGDDAEAVLIALDELCRERILDELEDDELTYDFAHPLIRETLYGSLTRARCRLLHARVATALEARYGGAALDHADELAFHFVRAYAEAERGRTVRYLTEAGRRALVKYANREAADYLRSALERIEPADAAAFIDLAEMLAQARQRLGEYDEALQLWDRVRGAALERGEAARAAAVSRRMGLACYWSGELAAALQHFDEGLAHAADLDAALVVRLFTAKAVCLQELGRPTEAIDAAQRALAAASTDAQPEILARVHRTFLQLHLWMGDAALASHHGTRALELADASGTRPLAFIAHWAMGVLSAFSGDAEGVQRHLSRCQQLADELRAPVMLVWSAELALEFASARGEWDEALRIGEEAIRMARALHQRALLPRLLVWTALIYLNRGDLTRGEAYVEEAWRLAGGDRRPESGANIHGIIPAYIGRTAVRMARGEYAEAIRIGEEGVAIADRAGYVLWAVHRLLPMIAESHLWRRDLEGAGRTGERLRRDAVRLGHRLGIGWADACDACVVWLGGDSETGAVLMRRAAEQLEAMPFLLDATRLRRQLAGRLFEIGERDAALDELRLVHDRLLQLGAEQELRKARQQFREMGARPPARGSGRTRGRLTGREQRVAKLVAERRSSKAIARELGISARTVDAHRTNIYRKLGINSSAELTDLVREGALQEPNEAENE